MWKFQTPNYPSVEGFNFSHVCFWKRSKQKNVLNSNDRNITFYIYDTWVRYRRQHFVTIRLINSLFNWNWFRHCFSKVWRRCNDFTFLTNYLFLVWDESQVFFSYFKWSCLMCYHPSVHHPSNSSHTNLSDISTESRGNRTGWNIFYCTCHTLHILSWAALQLETSQIVVRILGIGIGSLSNW